MTTTSKLPIPVSSTDLPPVERRPAMPAGFKAGGVAAGIKASGRPDLAVIVSTVGPVAAAAVFTPERVRGRARPPVSGAPGRDVGRPARRVRLGRGDHLDEWQRERGDRRRRRRGPARDRGDAGRRRRRSSPNGRSTSRPGSSGRGSRSTACGRVSRSSCPDLAATDDGLLAAAEALRTTDSKTKVATTTVELPDADGRPVAGHRQWHGQGRRDDPPTDGDDAVGRVDRRLGQLRMCSGACSDRRRPGRGTSSRSMATRARTTPSSSWRRGRQEPRRWGPAPRLPPPSAPPSRRSRETSPASRRPTARAPPR